MCSMARLGMHTAPDVPPGIWARVKAVPAATRRSIVGVMTHGLPSARMVSKRWSSVKKNRMLGGLRLNLASGLLRDGDWIQGDWPVRNFSGVLHDCKSNRTNKLALSSLVKVGIDGRMPNARAERAM